LRAEGIIILFAALHSPTCDYGYGNSSHLPAISIRENTLAVMLAALDAIGIMAFMRRELSLRTMFPRNTKNT